MGNDLTTCQLYEFLLTKPTLAVSREAALAAQAWVEVCELLDLQFPPLGRREIDALGPALGNTVIDIGCGAGQSTLQFAGRVGAAGRVIGVDIAAPFVDFARHKQPEQREGERDGEHSPRT